MYNWHQQRQSCKKTREQAAEKKLKDRLSFTRYKIVLCLCFELKLLDVTLDALDLNESKNSMSFNLNRAHNAESATNLHDEIAAYMILSYAATSHSSVADHDVAFNDQNRSSSSMSRISDCSTVFANEGQLSRQNFLEIHNLENQRTEYSAVHNSAFANED